MMWIREKCENSWRSASEGLKFPLGCEWIVPTTEKSIGSMWSWNTECRSREIVPGRSRSSVITPSSARRIAANSFGYVSFDASRIIRSVFRRIPKTFFANALPLAHELLFDPLVEVLVELHELRAFLGPREPDVLRPREGDLVLPVEDEEAPLRLRDLHAHVRVRRHDDRPRGDLERSDRADHEGLHARVHDRPAHAEVVRRRPRGRRDDDPVRPDLLREGPVEPHLEVADLRDLRGVEDGLVRTIVQAFAVHADGNLHALLDRELLLREPGQRVREPVRRDLRQESEGAAVDPEHLDGGPLERPENGAVPADREHDVDVHRSQFLSPLPERGGEVRLEDDGGRGPDPAQDLLGRGSGVEDVGVGGDAELHGTTASAFRSPTATRFVRALSVKGRSSSLPSSGDSTNPPASRTRSTPAAMSMTRNRASSRALM